MRRGQRDFSGHVIQITIQLPFGNNGRILQLQRTRRRIPRVGKQSLSRLQPLLIQSIKHGKRHQNLPPNLELRGIILPLHMQRHRSNSPYIRCHVIPPHAITPCHRHLQITLLVAQADRSPVILQLADILHVIPADTFPHPLVKIPDLLFAIRVRQGHHAILMRHLHELIRRVIPHPLCR